MLSVVVPCYNEEKNLPLIFERFKETLTSIGKNESVEVLFVNNGSTDQSKHVFVTLMEQYNETRFKVVTIDKNQGYGYGILTGLRAAKGDVLSWTHADMQTDPKDVIRAFQLYQKLVSEGQTNILVKGLRVNRPFSAWLFTMGMSVVATFGLHKIFHDINAQPKLFSRTFFNKLSNPPFDFSLDLYLLYQAKVHGVNIHYIDVNFAQRIHGVSNWNFSFRSRYKTIMRTVKYIFSLKEQILLEEKKV